MTVIQVDHVRRVYRLTEKEPGLAGALRALVRPRFVERAAVDNISFSLAAGEMVGYIGVNGAGKSTTIKLLTGILTPTAGSVRVLGRDPHRERVANARDIGVVFGQRSQLWWDLALIESLSLIAKIYDVPAPHFRDLLARFSAELELDELLKVPVRAMSLGQKMRAELAATLIHEPKIVYLDEPTIGLDLLVKERIRAFIRNQNRENGTTVLLTTHDLGDIEELCRRVILIDQGRVIYDGPISAIKERFGRQRTIRFETAQPLPAEIDLPVGCSELSRGPRELELRFDRTRVSASQVAAALMSQLEVTDLAVNEPDLAGIVRQIYAHGMSGMTE